MGRRKYVDKIDDAAHKEFKEIQNQMFLDFLKLQLGTFWRLAA